MEGDIVNKLVIILIPISIHSLRMEGDPLQSSVFLYLFYISIHSLRMEGDISIFFFC